MRNIFTYLLIVFGLSARAQFQFAPVDSFLVGSTPHALCSADFNLDSNPDIATADYGSNNVSLLLGDGTGHFGAAIGFLMPTHPYDIITDDFNNDSKPDLAVADYSVDSITILLGDGAGGFPFIKSFLVGGRPTAIAAADFNKDGNKDLAIVFDACTTPCTGDVYMFLGNGTGSFTFSVNFNIGSPHYCVVTSDFNGDGNQDIATAGYASPTSGEVETMLGNGNGTFSSPITKTVGYQPHTITCTDYNNDGKTDLVIGITPGLEFLTGNGNGVFSSVGTTTAAGAPIACADFDLDGKVDGGWAAVAILPGNGNGFSAAVSIIRLYGQTDIITPDLNKDGKPDIAVSGGKNSNRVFVLINSKPNDILSVNSESGCIVYPSPVVNSSLHAELTDKKEKIRGAQVYDMLGNTVSVYSEISGERCDINVSMLAEGCYYLKVTGSIAQYSKKFMVIKN